MSLMDTQYQLLASWAPFIAGMVTFLLTRFMLRSSVFSQIQDIPNQRSLHERPTPRVGGLALILGVITGWHLLGQQQAPWLSAAVISLMLLSLLDDLKDLPARFRLLTHFLVAIGFVSFVLHPIPFYLAFLFVLCLAWMTNIYNFMDGANGLAGGMAVIGFGFFAMTAACAGDNQFALVNLVIVGSSLAFLWFNFGKAKVFMGDAGSVPLGFLAAAIGLMGWQKGLWPAWFPVVIFSSFIVDATVTLFKRLFRGERVWEAHRGHYYQRLIQMGWSHQKTSLVEYALMLSSGLIGLFAMQLTPGYAFLLIALCFLVKLTLMYIVDVRWRTHA